MSEENLTSENVEGADGAAIAVTETAPAEESPAAGQPQPIEGLIPGRPVHYVLDRPYSAGEAHEIRPAIIVRVWDRFAGTSNLQVFTDGSNDRKFTGETRRFPGDTGDNIVWKTSIRYSEGREPGTWHWPPRG